tara:strand:+ start:227 stop:595 length:369 start_codon:yes stop_codon:yes gene_type:complete
MKNYFLLALLLGPITFSCSSSRTITKERDAKETNAGMQNVTLIDQLKLRPGLRIRGNQVFLNGVSSINSPKEVLFVVNGTQVIGLPRLNPQLIKRIEVLKNPSDIAEYGIMGSGGVVMITME